MQDDKNEQTGWQEGHGNDEQDDGKHCCFNEADAGPDVEAFLLRFHGLIRLWRRTVIQPRMYGL